MTYEPWIPPSKCSRTVANLASVARSHGKTQICSENKTGTLRAIPGIVKTQIYIYENKADSLNEGQKGQEEIPDCKGVRATRATVATVANVEGAEVIQFKAELKVLKTENNSAYGHRTPWQRK
jgi:hypothetical protein